MAAKIRKGDKVVVLAGRDKGRTGEVTLVMRPSAAPSSPASTSSSATPARAPRAKAASSRRNRRSTCPTWRSPIPRPQADRVGFKTLDDGRKVRVAKRSGDLIDG